MTTRIPAARVVLALLGALAAALALLYLGEYFGWRWVREAGGLMVGLVL